MRNAKRRSVIPSERSESRDLHVSEMRNGLGKQELPEAVQQPLTENR